METIDKIGYGGLVIFVTFFIVWAIRYFRYEKQLREAFSQAGMQWPFSQQELTEEMRKNLFAGYRKMLVMLIRLGHIILFMHTDNPVISKPLWGIRWTLLTFLIFPIILAFVLLLVAVALVPK